MRNRLKSISQDFDRQAHQWKRGLAHEFRFVRNWLQSPLSVGAIAVSSKSLAQRMAGFVDPLAEGCVVELGPGTGIVTRALIERGIDEERLVLIEYSPDFGKHLRVQFPKACIIIADAYDVARWSKKCEQPIAAVVSGLPLLTKSPPQRRRLVEQCLDASVPNAPYVQFSYAATPPVPAFDRIELTKGPTTLYNLPPARIWVYRKPEAAPE